MELIVKEGFLSHSKSQGYISRIKQAEDNLDLIFSIFSNPSVSFSGGKDSLVLLHLCLKKKINIKVWHFDWGIYTPGEIEQEIKNILFNFFKLRKKQLKMDRMNSINHLEKERYKTLFQSLNNFIENNQIDISIVGFRSQESCHQKRMCKQIVNKKNKSAYPIRHLTNEDIWAYLISNNIPYPSSYDKFGKIFGWENIKLTTFFNNEFESFGAPDKDKFLFYNLRDGIL